MPLLLVACTAIKVVLFHVISDWTLSTDLRQTLPGPCGHPIGWKAHRPAQRRRLLDWILQGGSSVWQKEVSKSDHLGWDYYSYNNPLGCFLRLKCLRSSCKCLCKQGEPLHCKYVVFVASAPRATCIGEHRCQCRRHLVETILTVSNAHMLRVSTHKAVVSCYIWSQFRMSKYCTPLSAKRDCLNFRVGAGYILAMTKKSTVSCAHCASSIFVTATNNLPTQIQCRLGCQVSSCCKPLSHPHGNRNVEECRYGVDFNLQTWDDGKWWWKKHT